MSSYYDQVIQQYNYCILLFAVLISLLRFSSVVTGAQCYSHPHGNMNCILDNGGRKNMSLAWKEKLS